MVRVTGASAAGGGLVGDGGLVGLVGWLVMVGWLALYLLSEEYLGQELPGGSRKR